MREAGIEVEVLRKKVEAGRHDHEMELKEIRGELETEYKVKLSDYE